MRAIMLIAMRRFSRFIAITRECVLEIDECAIMRDIIVGTIRIFDSFVLAQRRVVANHLTRSESVDLQKSEVLVLKKSHLATFHLKFC